MTDHGRSGVPVAVPAEIDGPSDGDLPRGLAIIVAALVCLPLVVAIVQAFDYDFRPTADRAVIEFEVRDVGDDTPLVGPYSRFGWNHPGPLLFYVLAIPYRLMNESSAGLLVGAGLVNLASVLGTLWVARRHRGDRLFMWTAVLLAVLLRAVVDDDIDPGGFLVQLWNPYIAMLPLVLLGLVAWSIADGDFRLTPLAVLLISFVAQSHIGFVPVVGVLALWIGAWLVVHRGRLSDGTGPDRTGPDGTGLDSGDTRSDWIRWVGGAALLGAILWLPVIIEQLTADDGNLTEIGRYFLTDDSPSAGFGDSVGIYALHLSPGGAWAWGTESRNPLTGVVEPGRAWELAVAVTVFAAAAWVAHRTRQRSAQRLQLMTALTLSVGFLAASRVTRPLLGYVFQWMRPLSMLLWLSVGWTVVVAFGRRVAPRVRRAVVSGGVAGVAILSLVTTASVRDGLFDDRWDQDAVAALAPDTIAAIRDIGGGPVLIWPIGQCLPRVAFGVALALERAGVPVVFRYGREHVFGSRRLWDGTNAQATVVVACARGVVDRVDRDGTIPTAVYSELSRAERDDFRRVRALLTEEAIAAGREGLAEWVESGALAVLGDDSGVLDPDLVARYQALYTPLIQWSAVFVEPPLDEALSRP